MAPELAPPLWMALPFIGLLLSIMALPLARPHFWEPNRNKVLVSFAFGLPAIACMIFAFGHAALPPLLDKAREFVSFLLLLASLFVVTGGIHLSGSLSGTPLRNTMMLGLGAVLANVIGTTGASMLLIRPLLRANAPRARKTHIIVMFIFIVSNCGGLLTPLGDPPLFLGFLKGVPFEWTLGLWKPWLVVNGALVIFFNFWDERVFEQEEAERPGSQLEEVMHHAPLHVAGLRNLVPLLGVVLVIFAAGRGLGHAGVPWPFGVAEAMLAGLTALSFVMTPEAVHRDNGFTWGPMAEVAVVFAGIFATMGPALLVLNTNAANLGLHAPWQFFWATGALSSLLDNAPTYLTFAATASGLQHVPVEGRYLAEFLARGPANSHTLAAISCGAVMMGANTYIGNGPNFMVKAIAESSGVRMPGFLGYMMYSSLILLPLFVVVTFLFFR